MNSMLKFLMGSPAIPPIRQKAVAIRLAVIAVLATLSLHAIAADIPATPGSKNEQRSESSTGSQENLSGTTLQQRIELRKKTRAHWRDQPAGDRASRLKARREHLEKDASAGKSGAPVKNAPGSADKPVRSRARVLQ